MATRRQPKWGVNNSFFFLRYQKMAKRPLHANAYINIYINILDAQPKTIILLLVQIRRGFALAVTAVTKYAVTGNIFLRFGVTYILAIMQQRREKIICCQSLQRVKKKKHQHHFFHRNCVTIVFVRHRAASVSWSTRTL